MKKQSFVLKKSMASKLLAFMLAVAMVFNVFASALPVFATTAEPENLEAIEENVPDIEPTSGDTVTYTVNVIGFAGDGSGTGFTLTDLENSEQISANFTQESNQWWRASFESDVAELSLNLQGATNRPTAFGTSFVLTPEFSTVYIFWDDMSSTLYAIPRPDGTIAFTVMTQEQNIHLAGTFNGWTPTAMTRDTSDELLELLTPMDGQVVPAHRVYTATVEAGFGDHEFKMLIGVGGWAGGTNAMITVAPSFDISIAGPATLIGAGNHTFTAAIAPAPVGTIAWAIEPAVPGISVVDGVVTVAEAVPDDTAFTLTASYGGVTASRTVRFFATQPETVTLTVNYFRHDQDYARWNLWLWRILPTSMPGLGHHDFTDRTINGDLWRTVSIEVPADSDRFGFIVRLGTWERQNAQIQFYMDRDAHGNVVDTEIFFIEGDRRYFREVPYLGPGVVSAIADWHNYIRMTMNYIPPGFNASQVRLYDVTDEIPVPIPITAARQDVGRGSGGSQIAIFHIDLPAHSLSPQRHYQMVYGGQPLVQSADVIMRSILDQYYHSNNRTEPLGATWSPEHTTFRLWTPVAINVELALYHDLDQRMYPDPHAGLGDLALNGNIHQVALSNPDERIQMTRDDETGVWSLTVDRDLAGYYYMFRVTHPDGNVEYAIDPYVTAVTANGNLGAIISDDPETGRGAPLRDPVTGRNNLNPDGPNYMPIRRDPSRPLLGTYQVDHIIYELHIRDFSIHPSSGISYENRGNYLAFTERGTTVNGVPGAPSTGIDHLIELGVTTVHLLPMYDQATINELGDLSFEEDTYATVSGVSRAFNWGYDPQNFNAPEGSFSSDPTDPAVRIREMKAMIDAMHEQGIRVVKDVVYNHTYSIFDGPFQRSVPNYFHRSWCNGMFSDGAGVGNEIASERPMVRQYIIDSLLFWQSEFGIDGFRFDLMWLHDTATMYEAVRQLREVDPDVIIYGEPWRASASPLDHPNLFPEHIHQIARDLTNDMRGVRPTYHATVSGQGFGVFNDTGRNAVRGGNDNNSRGFISGASDWQGSRIEPLMWRNIRSDFSFTWWASEGINYVGKHDNLVLFDNVSWSLGSVWGGIDAPGMTTDRTNGEPHDQINNWDFHRDPFAHIDRANPMNSNPVRATMLGHGLTLTSQGVPFLHAGDEFLRTKHGHRNTYNSPDFYNAIRWYQKEEFSEVNDFNAGLIQLRRERPAFRMNARWGMDDFYHLITASAANPHVVAYRLGEHAGGDSWRNIYVAMNGSAQTRTVNLGNTTPLNVVVDATRVGRHPETGEIQSFREIAPGATVSLPPFSMIVAFDEDTAVESDLTGIAINPGSLSVNVDETFSQPLMYRFLDQLGNTYRGDVAGFNLTWTSADPTIATINAAGVVTGVNAGTTEVILTATRGTTVLTATAEVRVGMQRYLVVLYDGPAHADLWVWEINGSGGREVPLSQTFGDHAVAAIIPVSSPDVTEMGVISRRNAGVWDTQRDFADGFHPVITLNETDIYTVISIPHFPQTNNQTNRDLVETRPEALTAFDGDNGIYYIHLRYRSQHALADAAVMARINGVEVTLVWNPTNQYFEYVFATSNVPQTVYEYEFRVGTGVWERDRYNPESAFTIPGESQVGCPTLAEGQFAGAEGAQWRLCEDGTLEVDEGFINWTLATSPWHAHRADINNIVFTGPITAGSSLRALFRELTEVETIEGLTYFDTTQTANMSNMFRGLSGVTALDVSSFDTSQVTNMNAMFMGASSVVALDLSTFDTSQVTDMTSMFRDASSLHALDLSSFNTSSVLDLRHLLNGATSLRELTLGVAFEFIGNANLPAIPQTDEFTGRWVNETGALALTSMQLITRFDGATMSGLWVWEMATEETCPVVVEGQFAGATGATWWLCEDGTLEVTGGSINWTGTNSPWHAHRAVINEIVFTGPIHAGTDLRALFRDLTEVTTIDGLSLFDTSQTVNMSNMFRNASRVTDLDISNFDTSQVLSMNAMFMGASSLTELDVSTFDTSRVLDMESMFRGLSNANITELDLSNFNTERVITMANMFRDMRHLEALDLSTFNTSQVTDMRNMLNGMPLLRELTLGEDFAFVGTAHLQALARTGEFTGRWVDETGTHVLSSAQLMANFDRATMAGTWTWQLID